MSQGMGGMPSQIAAPTPPPRQNSSPVNPFASSGGSDMFRPSPQQSPGPGMFRPSPQQSPQPSTWPASQTQAQQEFPPAQAFPPQQDFPPQQQAFPALQSFDSPWVQQQAFPPQTKQDMFGSATLSPFAVGPTQATSTPNQAAAAFSSQQQPAFGSVKVASDPFKDDPFFSSSTQPPSAGGQDKYSALSENLSQTGSSVFGDSSPFGGSGSVFDNATPTTNGASAGNSTMNNAFGSTSPTISGHSPSPVQCNASSDNLFQDLDVLGGGKKEPVGKSEFFKQAPKPTMAQLGASATPPPTVEVQTAFMSQPAAPDPFGSGTVNVSEKFNKPFANQSLGDKIHDPFDTSNITISPKTGPFDTSQLKPKPAESPPVQRSTKPNNLAFSTPEKNGAFEDSFSLPSPEAPPPPLPREASLDASAATTPLPRPTFARAATIDMTSSILSFDHNSHFRNSLKFGRQATVDMGDLAPPPAIPPRPIDANPPALPPRPSTAASITSNASSPVGTRRSSCTTPQLPPRPPITAVAVPEVFHRHPSPQTIGSSASSSHEPCPHHPPQTAGTVSRARPRPRPRTPGSTGSGSTSTTGSLTLTKLTEQPSATEHMQEAFVRDTQIRQSDNTQLTARRLANKTLVRNQSEPMFSSSLPDGFRDSFRASPADFSTQSSGADAFPVSFPPTDLSSARSQTPSEHSMDTDRVSESLTFDSARSHTDSPAFHSRSEPFPQDFDPFGDEQPKDPFSESPEEEVFTTKAVTVEVDPFADPFGADPFAGDLFDSRPKSGSSIGKESNADTSSQYSDCRSTQESHSHSNSDSQAEAHSATLPKEALSHWESFSEKPTPTEGDKTVVDKFAAAATASCETKDDALNTNGLTTVGEIRRDPFGSLDPLISVDIKAKLQIKENLQIKEELQWAFSNKNQPPEESRDCSASGANHTNQIDSNVTAMSVQSNQNFTAGSSDHVTSVVNQSELAQGPETEQAEGWATDDAFCSSSQQPFAAVNGGSMVQPMAQRTSAFGQMAPVVQQQMAPAMPPRPQSVGNPFAPNNQVCFKMLQIKTLLKFLYSFCFEAVVDYP